MNEIKKDPKEQFIKRCEYYANIEKSYTKQTKFLKLCRFRMLGDRNSRMWTGDELVWRIEILKRYFPKETEKMLEYVENEKKIREKKRKIREQRFIM